MIDSRVVGDALRARVQLAVGALAELEGEVASSSGARAFAAVDRCDGRRLLVTVHPAPPAGPELSTIRQRIGELRQLDHQALELPRALGAVEDCAWVVDTVPSAPAVRERVRFALVPLAEAVAAVRDLARALAAMHRRGIAHGAIDCDTVHVDATGARLGGTALSLTGTARGDLDALATVAWALFTGELERPSARLLSQIRRRVPPALDALCLAMLAPDPAHRPQHAEAILQTLDTIPTRRPHALASIVDAGLGDVRSPPAVAWLVAVTAIVLLVILIVTRT